MTHLPHTALIVGVGPGLGSALAQAFSKAGHPVALAARTGDVTEPLAKKLMAEGGQALSVAYDAADPPAVNEALSRVSSRLGPVETLVYNVGGAVWGGLETLTPEDFLEAWRCGPLGAFLHAKALFPAMAEQGGGSALFTGATSSVRAPAHSPAFGAAKFGLRGLALALARSWGPRGVHVSHILIDGVIRTPRTEARDASDTYLEPAAIASAYVQLASQSPAAWTFELDLRPGPDDYMEN